MADAPVTRFHLQELSTRVGPIALVTIDNGADWRKPSTFGPDALESLAEVLGRLRTRDWRGLVLTGKPLVFAVGADITQFPGITPERARERWLAQRGRSATLHSGHWMLRVREGRIHDSAGAATATHLDFSPDIDEAEIDAYVATGEPLEVAGAFTIDSLGGPFIDRVEGDPSTVVGMSLSTVRRLAAELGVVWTDLWNRT